MRAALSPADSKRLAHVLDLGHHLEKAWPLNSGSAAESKSQILAELTASIQNLSDADTDDLKRLAIHARNLSPDMTARHLAGILVPFERLQGKALRDDEFMVVEGDRAEAEFAKAPLKLVAVNLRSAFNVGALFRTAECFGAEEVVLAGYTPTPENDKTAKTSLGTQEAVTWSSASVDESLAALERDGYELVALETVESATDLGSFVWPEKSALLLGNERFGLEDQILKRAKHFVRIPLYGKKNSLNVGIAAGIALADWRAKLSVPAQELKSNSSSDSPKIIPATLAPRTYSPIGTFHSSSVHKYEAPRQGVVNVSEQEAYVELKNGELTQALKDLEGFSRVWLVYDFHQSQNWKPIIRPPRGPHEKRGVFATRTPYRPNSIGLSAVELVRVEGSRVYVKGHDLLDQTPILDLKPYLPYADAFPDEKIGWLTGIDEQRFTVSYSARAESQLTYLEQQGVSQMRGFIQSQLEFDPLDSDRKRVSTLGDGYQLAYRTWRAVFTIDQNAIEVIEIRSGYTPESLDSSRPDYNDKYEDKAIHREFLRRN